MSDPPATLWGMDHPWRRLRALSDWLVAWARLPGSLAGLTHHGARVIVLEQRMLQAERRCTLAHELEHVRRGPSPADPVLRAREERCIDRTVARMLIDIRDLGEALAWSQDLAVAADELWVDVPTLRARLEGLHPSERHYLKRRLEHHGD